jgi:hypothetical protein
VNSGDISINWPLVLNSLQPTAITISFSIESASFKEAARYI